MPRRPRPERGVQLWSSVMFSRHLLVKIVLLLAPWITLAGLSGCADNGGARARLTAGMGADLPRVYRLGVGDKLKIVTFGEADLSGPVEINAAGTIPMPLVGEIPARGLTLPELRQEIVRRLSQGFLKAPKVSVEVVTYRPIYIHGEVKNGGEFAFKNGLKIRDVVAMAGGYSYRANMRRVHIVREGDPQEYELDLPSDLVVLPGDNIRIPERIF